MRRRAIEPNTELWREFTKDAEILTGRELADKYRLSTITISKYKKELGKSGRTPGRTTPINYYTIYRKSTDDLVCFGTAEECAEALGVKVNTLYRYVLGNKQYDIFVENYRDAKSELIDNDD